MTDVQMTAREIATRIEMVRERVEESASKAARDPAEVTIVGVTKFADRRAIELAYEAGLRHFGENRVQDALRKFQHPLPADASLHMIGQLQTNKVKHALQLFDMVESVDRPSLIQELERQCAVKGVVLPVLLQVNVSGEGQKAGCGLSDAKSLIASIRGCRHLSLRGLMTIAPLVVDPEQTRPIFRRLRLLRDELEAAVTDVRLPMLSMGMTNDFPIAIEEGATHVRIGRAIFG